MNADVETKELVRNHWDDTSTAERYERQRYGNVHRSLSHYLDRDAIDTFIKNNFGNTETLLLDMACGTARLSRAISRPNRKVISADYSAHMLMEAKKKFDTFAASKPHPSGCGKDTRRLSINPERNPGLQTGESRRVDSHLSSFNPVRCDGFHLPFNQNTFDAVFTIRFIRHYRNLERIKIYSEISRILKNNGILIFDVLNKDMDTDAHRRPMYDEAYSLDGIVSELRDNGFVLSERLAGNITKDALFVILKKWSLTSLGRWYARRIRSRKVHLDNAVFWMVWAKKLSPDDLKIR
jgi:ubiquinone/menaquinone biosynthesis C-methylase UbiE